VKILDPVELYELLIAERMDFSATYLKFVLFFKSSSITFSKLFSGILGLLKNCFGVLNTKSTFLIVLILKSSFCS